MSIRWPKRRFKTADGRLIGRGVGEVLMELSGERRHVPAAFGEEVCHVIRYGLLSVDVSGLLFFESDGLNEFLGREDGHVDEVGETLLLMEESSITGNEGADF